MHAQSSATYLQADQGQVQEAHRPLQSEAEGPAADPVSGPT